MGSFKGLLSKLPGVAALGAASPALGSTIRRLTKDNEPAAPAQPAQVAQPQKDAMNRIRMSQGLPAMKKGGKVSSASKRADGCAVKGKTRGKIV